MLFVAASPSCSLYVILDSPEGMELLTNSHLSRLARCSPTRFVCTLLVHVYYEPLSCSVLVRLVRAPVVLFVAASAH